MYVYTNFCIFRTIVFFAYLDVRINESIRKIASIKMETRVAESKKKLAASVESYYSGSAWPTVSLLGNFRSVCHQKKELMVSAVAEVTKSTNSVYT